MTEWFELTTSADGQFRFVLKTGNAQTTLTSAGYTTKRAAAGGIASVQTNSALDERCDRRVASNGKHYFNLTVAKQQVIGTSQLYKSVASRDKGIVSVRTNGPTATIKTSTNDSA